MLSKYRRPPIRPQQGKHTHFEYRCNCFEELSGQLISHTHTHSPPAPPRHHSHSETRAGAGLTADHAAVTALTAVTPPPHGARHTQTRQRRHTRHRVRGGSPRRSISCGCASYGFMGSYAATRQGNYNKKSITPPAHLRIYTAQLSNTLQ